MTDTPSSSDLLPLGYKTVSTCPLIYFDFVPTHGTLGGAVQIELAARTLAPSQQSGGVIIETIEVGRLRCSPMAAKFLRDALDAALKMLENPQDDHASSGKLN
jgi:hypothetical protein